MASSEEIDRYRPVCAVSLFSTTKSKAPVKHNGQIVAIFYVSLDTANGLRIDGFFPHFFLPQLIPLLPTKDAQIRWGWVWSREEGFIFYLLIMATV